MPLNAVQLANNMIARTRSDMGLVLIRNDAKGSAAVVSLLDHFFVFEITTVTQNKMPEQALDNKSHLTLTWALGTRKHNAPVLSCPSSTA